VWYIQNWLMLQSVVCTVTTGLQTVTWTLKKRLIVLT
jgi:hypothetical protein